MASRLIAPAHRKPILAFYEFVRVADDIADHATLTPQEKLALLDRLEANLLGRGDDDAVAVALREALQERALAPRHAQDLLTAFRRDVTKLRYDDWPDLIDYCRYSAMPVGRFVLDVHGESRATWPANDALCAALQIINHLQDCRKDYRSLDRVYVPLDALNAAGARVEEIGNDKASPALLACIRTLSKRTRALLAESDPFPQLIADYRLAMEVTVIRAYAQRLLTFLDLRDPLSERVHLGKAGFAGLGIAALVQGTLRRLTRSAARARAPQDA